LGDNGPFKKDTQVNNSTIKSEGIVATPAQEAVGKLLHDTREIQGLIIADIARVLRISTRYLEALEEGRNNDLPGTTYAIGFIRSYAEHLRLDGDEIVRRYKEEGLAPGGKPQLIFPKPIPEGGVPGAAVLGLGVVIAFVAYGVWYYNSNNDPMSDGQVDPVPEYMAAPKPKAKTETPKVIVETPVPVQKTKAVIAETAVKSPVSIPVSKKPVSPAVIPKVPAVAHKPVAAQTVQKPVVEKTVVETVKDAVVTAAPVVKKVAAKTGPVKIGKAVPVKIPAHKKPSRVTVRAKANSWIQIRDQVANRLLFTRLLREGDKYEVPNRAGLHLMTGNAGALEMLVDGKVVPSIGDVGVVRRDVDLNPEKLKSGAAVTD